MSSPSLIFKLFLGTLIFSAAGTVVSHFGHMPKGISGPICSAILILSGSWLVLRELRGFSPLLLLFFGALAEIVGVYTGVIFGSYRYTDAWAPVISLPGGRLFPILVPFAWVFVAGGSFLAVRGIAKGWTPALLAGLLAAAIDAPMERAMTGTFGYWKWDFPGQPFGAPVQNAIGWFVIASLAAFLIAAQSRSAEPVSGEAPMALTGFGLFVGLVGWLSGYDLAWPTLVFFSLLPLFSGLRPTKSS